MLTIDEMLRSAVANALRELADAMAPVKEPQAAPEIPCPKWSKTTPANCTEGYGTAHVYIAGCSSLKALSRRLKMPVFKIGATRQKLEDRQNALRGDRYSAATKRGSVVVLEAGFDDWEMRPLRAIELDRNCPVTITPCSLQVQLTLPFPAFEGALRTALRPKALSTWATSPAGRLHLVERGIDPAELDRFTVYGYGLGEDRVSRCTELYVVKPRDHLHEIIDIITAILTQ